MFEHLGDETKEAAGWASANWEKLAVGAVVGVTAAAVAREFLVKEAAAAAVDLTEGEASASLLRAEVFADPATVARSSGQSLIKFDLQRTNLIEEELAKSGLQGATEHPNLFPKPASRRLAEMMFGRSQTEAEAYYRGFSAEYSAGDVQMSRLESASPVNYEVHTELFSRNRERLEFRNANSGFNSMEELTRKRELQEGIFNSLNAPASGHSNFYMWTREMAYGKSIGEPVVLSDRLSSFSTLEEAKQAVLRTYWPQG